MPDAALDGDSAADSPFGKATPGVKSSATDSGSSGDIMKGLVSQTQAANAEAQGKLKELPGQIAKIHADTDIKEKSLYEQLQTLTAAQVEALKAKPPAPQSTNLAEQWGSPAMLLAIFGSAFTRTPLTNALNAGAKVMGAYQQRDFDAANQAYKEWEHSNDTALKLTKIQTDMLENAMKNIRESSKEDISEKMGIMRLIAGPGALNIPAIRAMADAGQWDRVEAVIKDLQINLPKMQGSADDFKIIHGLTNADRDAAKELAAATASKDPERIAAATEKQKAAHQAFTDESQRQRGQKLESPAPGKEPAFGSVDSLMKKWHEDFLKPEAEGGKGREPTTEEIAKARAKMSGDSKQQTPEDVPFPEKWDGMPNKPPPGVDPGVWSSAITYVKSGGNIRPPFSLRSNSPMAVQFNAALPAAQHALEIPPEDMTKQNIKFAGDKRRETAIQSAFGGGTASKNLVSLNTLPGHINLLREYGEALQNKDVPAANQVINRMAMQAGFPEVVQFALAGTITGDETVRLLTQGGGTIEDREGIHRLMSEYGSPAQIFGAADVLERFIGERLGPLEQQYAQNDPVKRRDFEDNMLVPDARAMFIKARHAPVHTGPAKPSPPAAALADLKAHHDDPVYLQSFEKHFGKEALDKALAQ